MTLRPITRLRIVVGAVLVVATLAIPSAQRRRGGGEDMGLPVDTSVVLQSPDAFVGKSLTMSAGVEEVLSKTAFVIDQRKVVGLKDLQPVGKPMLVIAPYLSADLDRKHYLLMRGQVIKFDRMALAAAASGYTLDIPVDVAEKYVGRPVLVATSVRDATYKEIAMKPIAPPTAADVALTTVMKIVGPASASLRASAEASDTEAIMQNVAKLKDGFASVETIWDDHGVSYPAQIAREARDYVAAIEKAVASGDSSGVKSGVTALNQTCQTCHAIYRERQDDGTYRIKAGSI